mgnify:FL=1|jgi:hypothetical protein
MLENKGQKPDKDKEEDRGFSLFKPDSNNDEGGVLGIEPIKLEPKKKKNCC